MRLGFVFVFWGVMFGLSSSGQNITHWIQLDETDSISQYFDAAPNWSEVITVDEVEFENLTLAATLLASKSFETYLKSQGEIQSEGLSTAFNYALQQEQFSNAKEIMKHPNFNPDVPCALCHGRTPLQQATILTEGGDLVERLWESSKQDYGISDDLGNTTFHYIVQAHHEYLIGEIPSISIVSEFRDVQNKAGESPIYIAARNGDGPMFYDLWNVKEIPSSPEFRKNRTADGFCLFDAILLGGNPDILNTYLQHFGYDQDLWEGHQGTTGLTLALLGQNPAILIDLLENEEFDEQAGEALIISGNNYASILDTWAQALQLNKEYTTILEAWYKTIVEYDFFSYIEFGDWDGEEFKISSFKDYFKQLEPKNAIQLESTN